MKLHNYFRYLFDLALSVLWIYIPLFHFGLKDSKHSLLAWVVILVTLAAVLYALHRRGSHSIYA